MLKKFAVLVSLAVIVAVAGCNRTTEPDDDSGNGSGAGNIFVRGVVMAAPDAKSQGMAWVEVRANSATGAPISDAIVTVNNDTLEYQTYGEGYTASVEFTPGMQYTLTVRSDSGNASASVEAPNMTSMVITAPSSDTTLPIGQDVRVAWEIGGEAPDSILASYGYSDGNDAELRLPGTARSYVIPGSFLSRESYVYFWLDAGDMVNISGIANGSVFGVMMATSVSFYVAPASN